MGNQTLANGAHQHHREDGGGDRTDGGKLTAQHGQQNITRASRSETSMKPRSASSTNPRSTTITSTEDAQRTLEQAMKPLNAEELYCGHGSVRNLVYSYEVFPLKERCDSDHKIRQIREERQREMDTVIEQKTASSAVAAVVQAQQQQQQQMMMLEEHQQQELLRQQHQAHMRKELSTISERTEHSVSHHINLIGMNGKVSSMSLAANCGSLPRNGNSLGISMTTNGSMLSSVGAHLPPTATTSAINTQENVVTPMSPNRNDCNVARPNSSSTPIHQSNLAKTAATAQQMSQAADRKHTTQIDQQQQQLPQGVYHKVHILSTWFLIIYNPKN